ncbi:hypothetical protein STEG23_037373, partial [Scotinomys teguina]
MVVLWLLRQMTTHWWFGAKRISSLCPSESDFHTLTPLDCSMMCFEFITTVASVPLNVNTLPLKVKQNHNG